MEVWHELELDDGWLSVEHEHAEPADECDLALFLGEADDAIWDFVYAHPSGHYHARMWGGTLVIRPARTKVIDLAETP
jgi:hypothetical protein